MGEHTLTPTYSPSIKAKDDVEQDNVLLHFVPIEQIIALSVGICIGCCCIMGMMVLWLNCRKKREKRKMKTDIMYKDKDSPDSDSIELEAINSPTASTYSQYIQRQNIPMPMRHNLPFGGNLGAMAVNSNSTASNATIVTIPMSISNNVNVTDLQPQDVMNLFQNVAMNVDELKTDNNDNRRITIGHDDHINEDLVMVNDDGTGTENTTGTSDEGTKEISSHASNSMNNDGGQLQIPMSSKMKIKLDKDNIALPMNIQTPTRGNGMALPMNITTTGGGQGSV